MLNDILKQKKLKLILASKSPRRQALLKGLDVDFEVKIKDTDESYPVNILLKDVATFIAKKKAEALFPTLQSNDLILTSDTVVIVNNELLGKPNSKAEAIEMLTKLSNTSHQVMTGVCLMSQSKIKSFSDTTTVYFKKLTPEEINYYINHYKPFDKAGGYGIQEWIGYIGIQKIEGSYFNVMGLPVHLIYRELLDF